MYVWFRGTGWVLELTPYALTPRTMQEHIAKLLIRYYTHVVITFFVAQFKIVVAGDSSCCSVMVAVMMVMMVLMGIIDGDGAC